MIPVRDDPKRWEVLARQVAEHRKTIEVPQPNAWRVMTPDQIWRRLVGQVALAGERAESWPRESLRYPDLIGTLEAEGREAVLRQINDAFRDQGVSWVRKGSETSDKADWCASNLIRIHERGGPAAFVDTVARVTTEPERERFLAKELLGVGQTGARDLLLDLGLVRNAIVLDARILSLLKAVDLIPEKARLGGKADYEEMERVILERVARPLGLDGVEVHRTMEACADSILAALAPTRNALARSQRGWMRLVEDRGFDRWKRGDQRVGNKPLMTLLLIGRAEAGLGNRLRFTEVEKELESLLRAFGPPRKTVHPEDAFWQLQSEDIWRIENAGSFEGSPPKSVLRAKDAVGYVPIPLWAELVDVASLRRDLAQTILDGFWPDTLHSAIRRDLGLSRLESRAPGGSAIAPDVLAAYDHRCAVCGFDGALGDRSFGLEVAHLRWRAEGGPDLPSNVVLLCSFHRLALDRGALGLSEDHRVELSQQLTGAKMLPELFYRFCGKRIRKPTDFERPAPAHIKWHMSQVFRGPAREASTS